MIVSSHQGLVQPLDRAAVVRRLRSVLPSLDGSAPTASRALTFRLPEIDRHLPHGLAAGALHEIAPLSWEDTPAALGFAAACLAGAHLEGPCLLVVPARFVEAFGVPYAHGLNGLGLNPGRLIVFKAQNHKAALWALEEALRSDALAAVVAVLAAGLDLKSSRRLHLAVASSETFLMVLRPAHAEEAGAALSRWRIGPAPAKRDRFGAFEHWRWQVTLERSRNGRTGSWVVEWDHAAHRFRLVGALADQTSSGGAWCVKVAPVFR
jgi:protein ImuA